MSTHRDGLTTNELADFWRHSLKAIGNMRRTGHLIEDSGGQGRGRRRGTEPHRYLYTSIDRIHQDAFGTDKADIAATFPTTQELLQYTKQTGEPALLTTPEVEKLLGLSRLKIYKLAATGLIVGFQLFGSGQWLYLRTSVDAYAKMHALGPHATPLGGVPLQYVQRLLGCSIPTAYTLCGGDSPQLLRVIDPAAPERFAVSHKSLLDYLRRNLNRKPDGTLSITPIQWCVLVLGRGEELLRIRNFKERNYQGKATVKEALTDGSLACLWSADKREARIPEDVFYEWLGMPE